MLMNSNRRGVKPKRNSMLFPFQISSSTFLLLLLLSFLGRNSYDNNHNVMIVMASSDAASSSSSLPFGISKGNKIPEWISIHKDKEKLSTYLDLARQRHFESIQKARDAYFHGGPINRDNSETSSSSSSFSLKDLQFDERTIDAAGSIPDFSEELERKCFVVKRETPLFTKEECQSMIDSAESYFATKSEGGEWTSLPSGQYDVAGFWIKSIPECHQWFNKMVQERLFPLLVEKFPDFCPNMEDLVVDNAYVFKYTPETGRRTDVHTDSGCLSFTIALNSQDEYSGGGTWFEGLQDGTNDCSSCVIEMDVGQCTVRPGGVRHCGHAVTEGTRYIIGGFCMNTNKVEYTRMLMGLGSEETQKGNYKKAEEALEAAIVLNPSYDGPYSHLANLLSKQGNTAKAEQVLRHCLEYVNPQGSEIAYSLATIYLDQNELEKASKCCEICLDIDDGDVDAMMAMATICASRQDDAGEDAWCQQVISTPGAAKDIVAKAFCNLGVLHEGTDQEIEYYKKSIDLAPDNFPPNYSLACAYATKQDWDPAILAFRQAIDISNDGSDDEKQALQNLYRCVMGKLQKESPTGADSREAMMKRFVDVMGENNLHYNLSTPTQKK